MREPNLDESNHIILEMVDSEHSKFYTIERTKSTDYDPPHFTASWGRRGKPPQGRMEYSYSDMKKKLKEKLKKGYVCVLSEFISGRSRAYDEFMATLGEGWELLEEE